jgi:hypothetical protein
MGLKGFNLLQDNTAPPDMWDKIYEWVSKVGRLIVIVVEIIVIVSFAARVIIDTEASNLQEQEQTLSTNLTALKQSENNFRDMQDRFRTYKDIWGLASTYSEVITEVLDEQPSDVDELNFNVQGDTINFRGKASLNQIGQFEEALKDSETFNLVEVFEVESDSGENSGNAIASFGIRMVIRNDIISNRDTSWQT